MNTMMLLGFILESVSTIRIMPEGPVAEGFFGMPEPSSAEELAPFTLHAWGSPEELEALLAGGYPTPEIRATLEDASIPEEDRYWLDCRMRSLIAQMLHRFYDREGNVIEVGAEWISPGEKYWQEVMMVYPPVVREESPPAPHTPSGIQIVSRDRNEPEYRTEGPIVPTYIQNGYLYDLYGDRVGQLTAMLAELRTSRDGSIAILRTGGRQPGWSGGGALSFCFMYHDGAFREINISELYPWAWSRGNTRTMLSQDGSISAWNIFSIDESQESYILVYDRYGNQIESYEMPPGFAPTLDGITISGDNNFIACSGEGGQGAGIIDRRTGEIWWFDRGADWPPVFSENSRFCVMGGPSHSHRIRVVDLEDGLSISIPEERVARSSAAVSNDGAILATGRDIYLNGMNVISLQNYRHTSLSPNGYFYLGSSHPTPRGNGAFHILLNLRPLRTEAE